MVFAFAVFPRSRKYCVWHTNNLLIYPFSKVNNQHCEIGHKKNRLNRRSPIVLNFAHNAFTNASGMVFTQNLSI